MEFTAVFEEVLGGYIAFVEELPGTNTQGASLQEARENLKEAVRLVLDANRLLAEEPIKGHAVVKEPLPSPARKPTVKRRDLIRHLDRNGSELLREICPNDPSHPWLRPLQRSQRSLFP
ncbi:MAG: type II toxin-antitoxin system HicB family antitoxin [Steroidobacteraceae bacterium]